MSADMSRALALREQLVELAKDGEADDLGRPHEDRRVCAHAPPAAERRVRRRREVRIHPSANVGMAVATDRGLVVPVIRGAERLSIQEIAAARVELVDRARGSCSRPTSRAARSRSPTSGCSAVEQFVAVLNPPQVAILAVGAIEEKPVVRDGEITARR